MRAGDQRYDTSQAGEHESKSAPVYDDFFTRQQLAQYLGVHVATVTRAIDRGQLPRPVKVGKMRLWPKGAMLEYLARRFADQDA